MRHLRVLLILSALWIPNGALTAETNSSNKSFFEKNAQITPKTNLSTEEIASLAEQIRSKQLQKDPSFWLELGTRWGTKLQSKLLLNTLPTLEKISSTVDFSNLDEEEIVWIVDPWEKIFRKKIGVKNPVDSWQKKFPGEIVSLTPFTKVEDRASNLSLMLEKRSVFPKVIISSGLSSLTVRKALEDYPSLMRTGLTIWINIDGDKLTSTKKASRTLASVKISEEEKNIRECEENLKDSIENLDFETNIGIKTINIFSSDQLQNTSIQPMLFSGDIWVYPKKDLTLFNSF